jgi:hypothetical protein
MNDELENLRNRVAELEARDAQREREHASLMKTYDEVTASRDTLRRQLEEDYTLLGVAFDKRIDELSLRLSTGDGDSVTLAAVLPLFMKDVAQSMFRVAEQTEVRIAERMIVQQRRMCELIEVAAGGRR